MDSPSIGRPGYSPVHFIFGIFHLMRRWKMVYRAYLTAYSEKEPHVDGIIAEVWLL